MARRSIGSAPAATLPSGVSRHPSNPPPIPQSPAKMPGSKPAEAEFRHRGSLPPAACRKTRIAPGGIYPVLLRERISRFSAGADRKSLTRPRTLPVSPCARRTGKSNAGSRSICPGCHRVPGQKFLPLTRDAVQSEDRLAAGWRFDILELLKSFRSRR